MTHAAINLHRLAGALDPGRDLHGFVNLHSRPDGVAMYIDGYCTSWRVELTTEDAAELARALVSGETVAVANIGIGRATVDTGFRPGLSILTIKTAAASMTTEMTTADAKELATVLTALVKLAE
jgi:hypothetical protein